MYAAISLKGITNGAKVLEGQIQDWKRFGPPASANGTWAPPFNKLGPSWGLPRFKNARFLARFPFAYIDLDDKELPLEVQLKGWSPFIPTDADNSSLPVGAIEYSFKNTGNSSLKQSFHIIQKILWSEKADATCYGAGSRVCVQSTID